MKKLFPVLFVLAVGITIAIAAKANRRAAFFCCDDNLRKCAVLSDSTIIYGPPLRICP